MTNVVVIDVDDMRHDLVRHMPFVNQMRREATEFTACRLNVPVCQAARVAVLTGQYAHNSGVPNNDVQFPDTVDALPAWLETAGVDCAGIGKMPNGYGTTAIPDGWTYWRRIQNIHEKFNANVFDGSASATTGQWEADYLADQFDAWFAGTTAPFFAWITPTMPHADTWQYHPRPRQMTRLSWYQHTFNLEDDVSDKPTRIQDRDPITVDLLPRARREIRNQIREVRDVDWLVEHIYTTLLDAGVLHDTILVFTTDGGVFYGEHRFGFGSGFFIGAAKDEPYDVVTKVPLIVRGPGFTADAKVDAPTTAQDITALCLDAFDATPTIDLDGISLATIAADPGSYRDRALLYEKGTGAGNTAYGIMTIDRKLIRWEDETGTDEYEAYDLDIDPDEHANWANDAGRRAERDALEAELDQLLGI